MTVAQPPARGAASSSAAAPAQYSSRTIRGVFQVPQAILRHLRDSYSLDLRSLALFRIALGSILLGDLIIRAEDITAFYTDWGVLPRAALLDKFSPAQRFSIHLMSGQFTFQVILFVVAAIFALMLLVGVRTRLAAFGSWFMLVSIQTRNLEVLQGGDVYLRLLAFLAIFPPLGAVYSVDAALDTTPEQEKKTRRLAHFSTPGLALLFQVALVYLFAAILKTGPEWRRDHTAVWYALSIQQMSNPLGRVLLHFPKLLPWLTRGTLYEEATLPLLILTPIFSGPLRLLAAVLIFTLHIGIGLSIRLGHFPYVACLAALPLIPPWFWNHKVVRRLLPWSAAGTAYGSGLRIYYDGSCHFCSKMVRIVRTFLLVPGAELLAAQEFPVTELEMRQQHSWIVVGPDGRRWYKWQAFAEVASYSPLFGWLAPWMHLPWVTALGTFLYDQIEKRRNEFSRFTEWVRPKRLKLPTSIPVTLFGILVIGYIWLWNLSSVARVPLPPWQESLGITLDLDQRWDMFAPSPLTYDGWYVIDGRLRNGRSVNVLHPNQPVSYDRPASIVDQYKNERWRKYLMNLSLPENTDYRLYYGRYLCRSWNTGRWPRDSNALVSFDIYFMGRQNSISDPNRPYTRNLLWHHECFK